MSKLNPRRENYARQENFLNTIIAAFFNHTYNIVHKRQKMSWQEIQKQ